MNAETKSKKALAFYERFSEELGGEWELLSEYSGSHGLIKARHIPCGYVRTSEAKKIFITGCKECMREKIVRERFDKRAAGYIEEIQTKYNVAALTEYTKYRDPMAWRCNVCGEEISRPVENIHRNGMQHDCGGYYGMIDQLKKQLKAIEKRQQKIQKALERQEEILSLCLWYEANGYEVVDISGNLRDVTLRHSDCGRLFVTNKGSMKERHGCKACSRCGTSMGVERIEKILNERGIHYEREVAFRDCRRVKPLPFDFVLYDKQGDVICLVEFNGEQHYRATKFFGGAEKLRRVQEADEIKVEWCKANRHRLVVIKWDDDIERAVEGALRVL